MALITVFGGSGGIGRQIVKLLAKKGIKSASLYATLMRPCSSNRWAMSDR